MANDEQEADSKPFEATPRKLEEARKRGDVPLSQDLVAAMVFAGALISIFAYGDWMFVQTGESLSRILADPEHFAKIGLRPILPSLLMAIGAWFILPFAAALFGGGAQGAMVFAPNKIKPRFSRISPLSNAKQKFGKDGIFNFLKSLCKLLVYSLVLALICWTKRQEILLLPELSARQTLALIGELCQVFLLVAVIAMTAIAAIDFIWQRSQFLRKQRMSLKELKDETKETEGDPHTRQARRQKAQQIATNQMLSDVPGADVVIVNPNHFAVVLTWDRGKESVPICTAKGVDEIAARIREIAQASGVPIYRDPPTARTLFAVLQVGQEIPADHYRAVASAIRFADAIRTKAKTGWS